MPIGIGKVLQAGFGSDEPPQEVFQRYVKPQLPLLRNLGTDALKSLRTGGAAAEAAYNAGTARQLGLLGDQENISRTVANRRLSSNPEDVLRSVGNAAFGFIDPNVVSPLARFDVNSDRLRRMAAGLSPGSIDSTAQRLRDSRIASGRYYDTARQVYGALPSLYNQVFNAGVTNDQLATSQFPALMAAYRGLDTAPLEAARLRSDASNLGSELVSNQSRANTLATYGYQQPKNWADRLGDVDIAMRQSLQDAINMASQVYGGFLGGGAGRGIGGMMGGMGGGGSGGQIQGQQPPTSFVPSPGTGSPQGAYPMAPNPTTNWYPGYIGPEQSIGPGYQYQPQYVPQYGNPEVPTTFG